MILRVPTGYGQSQSRPVQTIVVDEIQLVEDDKKTQDDVAQELQKMQEKLARQEEYLQKKDTLAPNPVINLEPEVEDESMDPLDIYTIKQLKEMIKQKGYQKSTANILSRQKLKDIYLSL